LIVRNLFGKTGIGVVAAASILAAAGGAVAQPTKPGQQLTGPERDKWVKQQEMLRDFIHYVLINRTDVAAGMGQQLLNENLPPTKFVDLVEGSGEAERFTNTIGRAMRAPELEGTAASLLKLYEQGKLERVRNAEEITRNIGFLKSGNQRAVRLAQERLSAAGEYAIPQLLEALRGSDYDLRARSQQILIGMGQQAVTPLCTALVKLDPVGQELVADILGLVGYRTSLPYLTDTLNNSANTSVKAACERAIGRIGNAAGDAAELYEQLGEAYYAERPELTSFPGEPFQLLWNFDPTIGLTMTGIRTEVFHEAMAMRSAERSLELRPQGNDRAMSLWLASNFSREIQTPPEYDNPAYPKTRREAMYYAVAAGAGPSQAVLGRAIDSRNTPLARKAIAAVEQTAGSGALWTGEGDRRPLLEALRYPNRRVQYEAAMSLGKAQPRQAFSGSERVVPLLASAIRDAGVRYAAVIASDKERGAGIRKTLEKAGYTVLPVGTSMNELAQPIAEAPGVDLVVSNLNSATATNELIDEAKRSPKLAVTPILALTESGAVADQTRRYDRDLLVSVRGSGVNDAQLTEAAAQLVERSVGGPIKPEEARDYATKSLSVLRDLAVSGNTVFDVGDASLSLISALGETNGKMKLDIAEVLARVEQKRAQVALMDSAVAASGDERIALLGKVADSAKRYGNLLEPRQVERALDLAANAPGHEATAAAALVGSLNLSNTNLVPLILQKK
jgi:CheY-like chemotaxis protein